MNLHRLAFIGAGWVIQKIWLPVFFVIPGFNIIGIYDPFAGRSLQKILKQYPSIQIYDCMDELISSQPDLVLIATPNKFHVEYAEILLSNDVSVFIEKPICLSVNEYQRLCDATRQSKAKLLPSSASRLRKDVLFLQDLLNKKKFGKIDSMTLEWIRASGIPGVGSWFTNKDLAGGGVGYDLGWHMLDVGLSLLDYPDIQSASATKSADFLQNRKQYGAQWKDCFDVVKNTSVEDTMFGNIKTVNGVDIAVNLAWASHNKTDYTRIKINCKQAEVDLLTTFGLSPNRIQCPQVIINQQGQKNVINFKDIIVGEEYKYYALCIIDILNNSSLAEKTLVNIFPIIKSLELMYKHS